MCKLPEQVQAESLYCGWNLHRCSLLMYLKLLTSRTLESEKFPLYFFRGGGRTKKEKRWGLNIFHWFVFCLCSHLLTLQHFYVALWQIQVYNSCWFFCLLEKGFCLWKIWPYLFMDIFDNSVYFFFCCFSNLLVGQRDTVLTLPWPKKLLEFQLAGLFSNFFPWLLGHVANFMQLLCFSQKTGTFCGERKVCPLYILFILYLRSPWGRMFYITS